MLKSRFPIGIGTASLLVVQSLAAPVVSTVVLVASVAVSDVRFDDAYIALAVVSALLCYIFFAGERSTDEWGTLTSGWTIATRVAFGWIGVVCVLLLVGYATKYSAVYSRRALFLWFAVTLPVLIGTMIMLRQSFRRMIIKSGNLRKAVIAGVSDVSRQLAQVITEQPELGLDFRGFFDDRNDDRVGEISHGQLLGQLADIPGYVRGERIDTIFLAIPVNHVQRTRELLDQLRDTTVSIYFVPDIFVFDLIQAGTDDLNGIPVVALYETPFRGWRGLVKRVSDMAMASLMLLVALPVMVSIAVGIKLTSAGSVIFRQRRYGLDGNEITIYKFRTMTVSEDGDQVVQASKQDARVTPFGRFLRRYSLDELPQLINVLQGRMSVVGPRPHAIAHNEEYRKLISGYMMRHKVAPGITGLAQINGFRGETTDIRDMEQRVHFDLEYLRHWSLGMDMKILVRTLFIWFRDEKAF